MGIGLGTGGFGLWALEMVEEFWTRVMEDFGTRNQLVLERSWVVFSSSVLSCGIVSIPFPVIPVNFWIISHCSSGSELYSTARQCIESSWTLKHVLEVCPRSYLIMNISQFFTVTVGMFLISTFWSNFEQVNFPRKFSENIWARLLMYLQLTLSNLTRISTSFVAFSTIFFSVGICSDVLMR